MKKVAVIMESGADWSKMKDACVQLETYGIPYEAHVFSAQHTTAAAYHFARTARENGFGVIICAAAKSAHLAAAFSAYTTLPVIGVPLRGGAVDGLDALLSTVQMPSGAPVAAVALNDVKSAAVLAAQILAVDDGTLAVWLEEDRNQKRRKVEQEEAELQASLGF